jgi:ribosomal protein S18 acetylase RimI-like enzyme
MAVSIRRLGLNDQEALAILARDDADFDVESRGEPLAPLEGEAALRYLANPSLSHWVAEDGGKIVGFLCGYQLPLRSAGKDEFLLYEIGVRQAHRGRGIGRSLVKAMFAWMQVNRVKVAWVVADNPGALAFYENCGFGKVEGSLTQLEISLPII